MALLDAYVSKAEYSARNNRTSAADDATLDQQLLAMTRLFEREAGLPAGAFNSHTATLTFPARGGKILRLRDSAEVQHFLRSVPSGGIGVDTEQDGTFDGVLLSLASGVRGLPENAAALSEPYTAIELLPYAEITAWPKQTAAVRISTGAFGWAAVPAAVKEAVISMVRDLREHHVTQRDEDGVPAFSDQTWRIIRSAKAQYSHRLLIA